MRTRKSFLSFALLGLGSLLLGACTTTPSTNLALSTGNTIVTVTPKNVGTPQLVVTYWDDRDEGFTAGMKTVGEGFRIKTPGGWHDLEEQSKLTIDRTGGTNSVVLTDSAVTGVKLDEVKIGFKTSLESGSATADYEGVDAVDSEHVFAVWVMVEETLHILEVRAKG